MQGLGISATVESVNVDWVGGYRSKPNTIAVAIKVSDTNGEVKHLATICRTVAISDADMATHKDLTDKLEAFNVELVEVMNLIKQVGRKERQIRGRISEMKLQQSGMSELVNNPELIKLVQL
jgi:hypothetical protein